MKRLAVKSNLEIFEYVKDEICAILKRPRMYADTTHSLEITVVRLLELYCFIINSNSNQDQRMLDKWFSFARKEVGDHGALFIAAKLAQNNTSDEVWNKLTCLLNKFSLQIMSG